MTIGPRLNLVVIRGEDPDRLVQFYEAVGLRFTRERHGSGPEHYAAVIGDMVIEIYPLRPVADHTTGVRLGFTVESVEGVIEVLKGQGLLNLPGHDQTLRHAVLIDPAGHVVELTER